MAGVGRRRRLEHFLDENEGLDGQKRRWEGLDELNAVDASEVSN
jgi:hypothetical protein